MKHINSLAAAVFLAAALSSCAKMRVETEEIRPAGTPIRMAVSSESTRTKALFDADSFSAKGNVLQIWDVYFNSVVATPQAYIEGANVVSTGTGAVWPFKEGDAVLSPDKHYYWTKTGTHRFYGVLVKDNSGSAPLTPTTGWGFDAAHKVYSVPTTTLILTSPQFDFVYSNVIERNLDNGAPTTAVPLKFNHLFSAFGFTFENDSPSSFNIKSATLKVHDQAAATIDYSNVWDKGFAPADADNWNPEVTYTGLEPEIPLSVISGKTEVSLQPNTCYDMFHGDEITDMAKYDKYTLIWPQDLTGKTLVINYDMTVTRPYTKYVYDKNSRGSYKVEFTEVGAGKGSYKEEIGYSFFLTYTYYTYVGEGKGSFDVASVTKVENGSYNLVEWSENVTENKTLTIDLAKKTKGGKWIAGNKYLYNLLYTNSELEMKVTVMQWDGGHGGTAEFN